MLNIINEEKIAISGIASFYGGYYAQFCIIKVANSVLVLDNLLTSTKYFNEVSLIMCSL